MPAPNLGGDVSKSSQVRSTYSPLIQVSRNGWRCAKEAIRLRRTRIEMFSVVLVLRDSVSPLVTLAATGRSTAHTKCRNEVKDLKRSVALCGRAVANNHRTKGHIWKNYLASQQRLMDQFRL